MLVENTNTVQHPTLNVHPPIYIAMPLGYARALLARPRVKMVDEAAAVARFAARVNAFGPLTQASPALRARILEEVRKVAQHIDASAEAGANSGYRRRVLYEAPGHWSLAAIALRPGQHTEVHNHGGWGCAVTVQGIERDRRFVHDASGTHILVSEHNYPPGTGYIFDATDVHQPLGADPRRVTVALHFLVDESHAEAS